MDKYEYKIRADEIKALIAEGDYARAADIADTIDWRRVKSAIMLCTVSDLYKINRRYEDAKNMLLLAYERRPGGRTICYSLCELCIKTEEFVQALKYYKEFVQAAPKDPSRYILQYRLYEAQEVSLEERIGVLEELKKRDYREKWAYELAFLYHRVGLATRCVEECDEMILWFGDGKYVVKAMELKMLHQPLTPAQQQTYDHRFDEYIQTEQGEPEGDEAYEEYGYEQQPADESLEEEGPYEYEQPEESAEPAEMDIQVKTMDVGQYNTINLQAELAEGLQEVLGEEGAAHGAPGPMAEPDMEEAAEACEMEEDYENIGAQEAEEIEETEVFFGETGEISSLPVEKAPVLREMNAAEEMTLEPEPAEKTAWEPETAAVQERRESVKRQIPKETEQTDITAETVMEEMRQEETMNAQPPRELAEVLSQEADGQISLVLPEELAVEKQLTGQMKIEDVLVEWERMKKENEEKRREEVRQHVLRQTGPMFTEFEAAVRDGLLEQLESGTTAGRTDLAEELSGEAEAIPGDDGESLEEVPEEAEYMDGGEYFDEAEFAEEEAADEAGYMEEDSDGAENFDSPAYEEADGEEPAELEYLEEELYSDEEYAQEEELLNDSAYEEQALPEELEYVEEDIDGPVYEEEGAGELEYVEEEEDYDSFANGEEPEETAYAEYIEEEYEEEEQTISGELPEYDEDAEYESEAAEISMEESEAGEEESKMPEELEPGEEENEMSEEEAALFEELGYSALTEAAGDMEEQEKEKAHSSEEEKSEQKKTKDKNRNREKHTIQREKARVRGLTREEKELYAPFIQSRHSREQLVKAIDSISMAAYTGNIVVTGEEGMDTLTLAKNMIREVRLTDSNFSGKVAKISGQGLNDRNIGETLERLNNGALIIENASGMASKTAKRLYKSLQQERLGIIVVLEGTKKAVNKLFAENPELAGCFTARMDLEALSNDTLVSFGRLYAREMEYSIDDLGVLALHTRIEELQTIDHVVTVIEVKQIVDEAIHRASRKTLGHFFDILLAKRYDNEDMIILTEKDFVA